MKICLEGNSYMYLNGVRNGHLQIAICAHVLLFGKVGCFHGVSYSDGRQVSKNLEDTKSWEKIGVNGFKS